MDAHIPIKANRVLNLISLCLVLILVRVWFLTVVQHEEQVQKSKEPQRRTTIEHIERATIRDRFNIPLAVNKMQYNAAVCYAQIRQIPTIAWDVDAKGNRVRVHKRMSYITDLSKKLAKELDLSPVHIEDTIHAKAALFPHTPFVLKEDISEKQYYRLKMLERQWLGIHTERRAKRVYPKGKVAADIIGTIGAISEKNYCRIAREIKELREYLAQREAGETPYLPKGFDTPLEVRQRLKELQEKAYTINAEVGRAGIEAMFDEQLRGIYGKKVYEIDVKGTHLRELPGSRKKQAGKRVLLSISSELQEYAELLLAQTESEVEQKNPWIKGGAIVALHPKTGEVIALASHPRFDPNDFLPVYDAALKQKKTSNRFRWLENEEHIAEVWNGKVPLEKEIFSPIKKHLYEEKHLLTWSNYLDTILPQGGVVRQAIDKVENLKNALELLDACDALAQIATMPMIIQLFYSGKEHIPCMAAIPSPQKQAILEKFAEHSASLASYKKTFDTYLLPIEHNSDKLLVLDLCRLIVNRDHFPKSLRQKVDGLSLNAFRALSQEGCLAEEKVRRETRKLFHELDFTGWRNIHFKEFLKEKRKEEQIKKQYAKPYTEYLEKKERQLFELFWQEHRLPLLYAFIVGQPTESSPLSTYFSRLNLIPREAGEFEKLKLHLLGLPKELAYSYLQSIRSFDDLKRPLFGHYPYLRNSGKQQLEKHLAAAFYPLTGFGYGRSQAFRQSTPQGSVFKLVTAYETLKQRYEQLKQNQLSVSNLNPLTIIDDMHGSLKTTSPQQILGFHASGEPIKRLYKEGLLPRAHPNIGKLDLPEALGQSSNLYFSLLASDCMQDPTNLSDAARLFGFGEPTGIELPGEIAGVIPDDVAHNRTGLYSLAIGQHSLVVTPLQTAVMVASIVNGGSLLKPKIVSKMAGRDPSSEEDSLFSGTDFAFKEHLALTGIFFPLFTEAHSLLQKPTLLISPAEIKRTLFLPQEMQHILLEGMQRTVLAPKGTARASIIHNLNDPKALDDYIDLQHQIIGKTGTAEILYKKTIDAATPAKKRKHVWFAAIAYPSPIHHISQFPEPELVVIVYLRFGDAGKEAAPLAAQIIKKWREILSHHQSLPRG